MIPIAARPELRMHLRHQSYQGLILDQSLIAELASRCAYCNQQIGPRAIAKHYSDQHPDLMQYSTVHKDRVRWAANFGSGKSTCPLRRTQTQKLESYACGVLFQLTIMAGQTMQPEHYPITPVNKCPWTTASEYTNVNHPDLSARQSHLSRSTLMYRCHKLRSARIESQHICTNVQSVMSPF